MTLSRVEMNPGAMALTRMPTGPTTFSAAPTKPGIPRESARSNGRNPPPPEDCLELPALPSPPEPPLPGSAQRWLTRSRAFPL
jgi:hypothetical protein